MVGILGVLIVILEKSEKLIIGKEEIEENLDFFIKFVRREDKELNDYRKKIISSGIKSLFEMGKISYWDNLLQSSKLTSAF